MNKVRKGDIVGRISYNKDVMFEVKKIIKTTTGTLCILKGLTQRIEADSPLEDLEIMDKRAVNSKIKNEEAKILKRIQKYINYEKNDIKSTNEKRSLREMYTGRILHLDGDRKYSQKSLRYYRNLGLDAIVRNVPENKQAKMMNVLLDKYQPDILIITGHDGMIKKGSNFNDIYNYRNSRYFINAVNVARNWRNPKSKQLSIFAGACQSYYEGIMSAGANFASSPARIMIDFIDPLIVAEKIATTENTKYLTIKDLENELRDGRKGIDGIGTFGKKKTVIKKENVIKQ